ncbi:MAG: 4Fe-4S dicluster domain-containing protein [Thermodesulfovibrionales bacterium]
MYRKRKTPENDKEGAGKARGASPELSRRQFLGGAAALGGAAIIARPGKAEAYENFEGWPDSYGMLTDLTRCVGCRSCEKACNEANKLPKPDVPFDQSSVFDEIRRPSAKAYTVVNRYEVEGKQVFRKIQCNHCKEPACATACPIHAYSKTPEGSVYYDPDLCFGCRYCMVACPFYVPAYDYESALEPRIVKCMLCYERIKDGGMPACAEACPVGAVQFGKRKDLIKIARRRIMDNPDRYLDHIYGEHEVGGTNWLYISGVPFDQVGLPTDLPNKPPIELTKGFLSSVPVVFTVWPALFGMCYAALRHREKLFEEEKQPKEDKREESK